MAAFAQPSPVPGQLILIGLRSKVPFVNSKPIQFSNPGVLRSRLFETLRLEWNLTFDVPECAHRANSDRRLALAEAQTHPRSFCDPRAGALALCGVLPGVLPAWAPALPT